MTPLTQQLENKKKGCGKKFGKYDYYCGDNDYSDNPKRQYCPDCKKEMTE